MCPSAVSNGPDGRIFTVRLQGPGNSGKTYLYESFLERRFTTLFPGIVIQRNSFEINKEDFHTLYVFDDFLTDNNLGEYHEFVNQAKSNSVIVIITNTIYEKSSTWCNTILKHTVSRLAEDDAYHLSLPERVHSGVARRIGLHGPVYNNGNYSFVRDCDCVTVTFDRSRRMFESAEPTKEQTPQGIFNLIIHRSRNFLMTQKERVITSQPLNILNPDITIYAKDRRALFKALNNPVTLGRAYSSQQEIAGFRITLNPSFADKVKGVTVCTDWLSPEKLPSPDDQDAIIDRIVCNLLNYKTDATVLVTLGQERYEVSGNVIYKSTRSNRQTRYRISENLILDTVLNVLITPDQIAHYLETYDFPFP